MWSFPKRFAVICCTSLTASAALLSADNAECFDYSNNDCYSDYNCSESACGECCDSHWNFGAELLYWKSHADCTEIGATIKKEKASGCGTEEKVHVKTKSLDFKWKPGFRLNLGYKNPDCCWDFSSSWTYYYGSAEGSLCRGKDKHTSQIWAWDSHLCVPFSFDCENLVSSRLKSKFSLNYNALDFGLGHTYDACGCFTLRPHVDLKFAWFNERYTTSFHREFEFEGPGSGSEVTKDQGSVHERVSIKQKWTCVGPQLGLDLAWDLGCGWNLYAKGASAILYANPSVTERSSLNASGFTIDTSRNGKGHARVSSNHSKALVYSADLAAGFGWNTWLCDNSYLLTMKLGWEHHINFFPKCYAFGDIGFFGLNMGVGLDY